jgi:long-subunit fatty acid transport protein
MMMRRHLSLAGLALALAGQTARAAPSEAYGSSARSLGLAGALTADIEDGSAAYENPAGLGFGGADGRKSLGVGYMFGAPLVDLQRQKNDAARLGSSPTQLPSTQGFANFQLRVPLGGKLENRVTLGLTGWLPQDKLLRLALPDARLPQWTRWTSNADRFELAAAAGVRLNDHWSVGLGALVLAGMEGNVDLAIDLLAKKAAYRTLDVTAATRLAPVVGATWRPSGQLRVSASYRGERGLALSLPNRIDLGDLGVLALALSGTAHYSPHEFTAGASWTPSQTWKVNADLRYALWSLAPFPSAAVAGSLDGDLAKATGLDAALAFKTVDAATGFQDTLTPSVGVEHRSAGGTMWRAGYSLRPTYVPDPVTAASNLLDNTAHVVGFGASVGMTDPLGLFDALRLDLAGQGQYLVRRDVEKTRGEADPVGNYDFGGVVLAAMAQLHGEY